MQPALPATAALLLALAGCAGSPSPQADAREPVPPRVVLRGADCLDPEFARGWQQIDSDEVLVDAGRRHYRIVANGSCLFGSDVTLRFAGDPVTGRVCGTPGDRILTRDGYCWIDRIELIDAATWRDAQNAPHGELEATTETDR